VIYQSLCANCGNVKPRFPTTPGVWASNNGAANCNLAAVKIAFNLAGIGATIRTSIDGNLRDTTGCVPMSVDFTDTLAMGKQYIWDFNDGSPPLITNGPSVSHIFNTAGFYRVKLIAVDSSSCNISDSAFINLRVRNDRADLSFDEIKLPPCASLAFRFTNTSTALKPFANNSFRWDMGDGTVFTAGKTSFTHTYAAPGTYQVKMALVDTNFCNEPDSLVKQIRIASNVTARFNTPPQGCVPYLATFANTSLGGQTFIWDFGDGSPLSNEVSPSHLYASTGNYLITLTAIDAATCNISSTTSFQLRVEPNPDAGIDINPNPVPENEPVNFVNLSNGASRYLWIFGDGITLQTFRRDTIVRHLYNASDTYNACVVAFNPAGCPDTACIDVTVKVVPGVDVPNAFSPNGDGKNDRIFIKGFGIAKISWRIFSRWGELVFFTNDPLLGWDGAFKGKLMPQDVYHYVLDVEFSDGKKTVKKGDITLLR
jgi:gliding motility-associated-like protein